MSAQDHDGAPRSYASETSGHGFLAKSRQTKGLAAAAFPTQPAFGRMARAPPAAYQAETPPRM